MSNWYKKMNLAQKIFVYVISVPLILLYGLGLAIIAVMIFQALGSNTETV